MRALLLLLLLILPACTTVNCTLQSGEKNTVKSDMDQSPSTKADVPLAVGVGGSAPSATLKK